MRRPAGPVKAIVVGVYPSAFHVAWSPPARLDPRETSTRRRPYIASLAVDVEPVVFWDGLDPSPTALLEQWKTDIGFDDARHGSVSIGTNGPSGAGLARDVLRPLGFAAHEVAFTDAVPWFFVKFGRGSQGEAIRDRFGPVAEALQLHPGLLPKRPSTRQLVALAASDPRRESLRGEITTAGTSLVITLGQEALDAVREVADECVGVQERLTTGGYGQEGTLTIDSTQHRLLPLVHPGFQRQTNRADWKAAIDRWSADAAASPN
jgi:hypothetical protein